MRGMKKLEADRIGVYLTVSYTADRDRCAEEMSYTLNNSIKTMLSRSGVSTN